MRARRRWRGSENPVASDGVWFGSGTAFVSPKRDPLITIRAPVVVALAAVAPWLGAATGMDLPAQEPPRVSASAGVVVEGRVLDHETDNPIPGAAVSLGAGPSGSLGRGTRISDEDGRFRFQDVPEGTYRLSVTAQSYRDMNDTIRVQGAERVDLILPLSTEPVRLAPIIVTAHRPPESNRGYERRRLGGGSGFLVTREDIEERRPRYLTELLHGVPGGMVVPTPPHGYTLLLRAQCQPGIWMDGVQVHGARSIDQLLTPQNVEAVEVYHGFELPVEFGVDACGGVLIWTRRGPSAAPSGDEAAPGSESGLLGRLVRVAALVLVVVLVTR